MPLYQYRNKEAEKTFLFIHVPKTGGTAIETFFRGVGLTGYFDPPTYMPVRRYLKVPPTHYDYDMLQRLFELDSLYSFAVVRNPVNRMISQYKWALEKSTMASTFAQMNFSEFIHMMFAEYKKNENLLSGHYKPQVRFVGEKVTRVFRYEEGLDAIIRRVLEDLGFKPQDDLKIPVVNNSTPRTVVPSESDIQAIRDLYAEDFSAFGYNE